jgi:hypothetical protein
MSTDDRRDVWDWLARPALHAFGVATAHRDAMRAAPRRSSCPCRPTLLEDNTMNQLDITDLTRVSGGEIESTSERSLIPPGIPTLPPLFKPFFEPAPTDPTSTSID